MKKLFIALSLVAFALGARAQYQVGNSDFESWGSDANEPGSGWYSFPSARVDDLGSLARRLAINMSKANTTKITGRGGTGNAVHLISRDITIAGQGGKANGNLTTGRINMGSTTPNSDKNYNYTDRSGSNKCIFTGHPDAFEYWAKFKRGENGDYKACCHVVIHGDCDYKDPPTSETDANIAKFLIAEAVVEATPCVEWTKFDGEFEYKNPTDPGTTTYVLASFTTNPTAGGSAGDEFDIDDVRFIYYSQLSSLKVNGVSVPNFDKDIYYYSVNEAYTSSTLVEAIDNTKKGVATINVNPDEGYGYNAETAKYTIKVTNEEGTESHTYTIQFSKAYTEDLYVTVGDYTTDKQEANVLVGTNSDGTINFILKNFFLDGMPVGNIAVNNIEVDTDNSFTFNDPIEIAAGDDPNYQEDDWIGPDLGPVELNLSGRFINQNHIIVYISIDLEEYMVYVHLGYARLAPGAMAVNAEAKYGTFCAPFAVTIPSGVQAYTVPRVIGGVLDLHELTGTIPANTPVILSAESGYTSSEEIFRVAEDGTTIENNLLVGVYVDTQAPAGSYVLQNQGGKVGFYHVEGTQPTVKANRCYLVVDDVSGNVKAYYFNEDDATGIKTLSNSPLKGENIYNLAGQRLSKMQKGINIVNGKKVLK